MEETIAIAETHDFHGLCFVNLVDFDALYGHRRDAVGYATCLEEFDQQLDTLIHFINEDDLLIICADHGNDPLHTGTDHTREYVLLLAYSLNLKAQDLGIRETFSDIGATILIILIYTNEKWNKFSKKDNKRRNKMNESVKQVAVSYNLSNDGNIKGYKWFKEGQPFKGAFLISHGMAEHIERYDEFARELAEHNYIVYGHNQRGHKDTILSKQDYGYMGENNNFEIMVTDLSEICDVIKEEHPELPIILFGHSMGSFVSQRFAQLYGNKINGLIITGSSQNSNLLLSVGLLIARIICKLKGRRYRSNLLNDLSFKSSTKYSNLIEQNLLVKSR